MNLHIQSGLIACVLDGLTIKESARALDVSITTVKRHLGVLLREFGARSRAHLVAKVLGAV